jgi:5'-nucleotidase (lipoprotein e(P4) family)
MLRRLTLALLTASVLSCASRSAAPTAQAPAPTPATSPAPATAAPTPRSTEPDSIRWVRSSAEHDALLRQVYGAATAAVERDAVTRKAGAWAVILDADETVIDNSTYQLERARLGLGFSPESWSAWVHRREATALPGAAAFLARVHALGGRIAIVTNRLQSECADTEAVFKTHMLAYDEILCRADGSPSDKNPRFDAVASGKSPAGRGPLEVLAFVGDNILDFPRLSQAVRTQGESAFEDFGRRYFLVPNPMYGSWQ